MEKLQRKIDKLMGVMEVSKVLSSTLELQEVLRRALTIEQEVMGAEAGCLLLLNESGEELQFVTALGEVCNQLQSAQVKLGRGIAGWVAQHREALLVPDAYADPRFDSSWDRKTGFTTKSIVCIPLLNKDTLLGVAQVINRKDGQSFDADDLELFTVFGGQLAIAIANAALHGRMLEQQRMQQELETAQLIQRSFLPAPPPPSADLHLHASNIPARTVSGDFYDFFPLDERRLCIIIGDVSGKGVPAALYMANLMNMLRYQLKGSDNPGLGLALLNAQLFAQSQKGMFVTLALLVLDTAAGALEVFRAGHLPPLVLGLDGQTTFLVEGGGPPLGIIPDLNLASQRVQLQPGDRVILYTDGVTEAESGGLDLGLEGLAEVVRTQQVPLNVLATRIFAEVNAAEGQAALHDDLTVVALQWRPQPLAEYRLAFASDPRFLRVMRALIDQLGQERAFTADCTNKLKLALDEALTNIIRHSYDNRRDGRIAVTVTADAETLTFVLRDWGRTVETDKICSRELADVRPGGLGVHFIRSVMDDVDYDTQQEQGTLLTLRKRLPQKETA